MLERLAEAIDEAAIPAGADGVRVALRLLDRLAAKVAVAVGEFDAEAGWEADGATSVTSWLRAHAGMTGRDADRTARIGRLVRRLPATRAAWLGGSLSGGQVQAVAANLRPATVPLFAREEEAVVGALAGTSVADTAAVMRHWAAGADALVDGPDREPERSLHVFTTLAGRVEVTGSLDPESGAVVATAVRMATTRDLDGEPARTPAERRADALVDICRFFLDNQGAAKGGRHRPHLNVVVDVAALAGRHGGQLVDGPPLDGATVERLLCDSAVHRVVTAGRSTVLDYGTTTRTVPAPLWAALVVRDGHCRFPGCDRPPGWCEGHHVVPVSAGGPTKLENLVLLCTRHHHRCHHPGWRAALGPEARFEVTTPDGRVLTSHPAPASGERAPPPGTEAA